jgi:hypothetical protein
MHTYTDKTTFTNLRIAIHRKFTLRFGLVITAHITQLGLGITIQPIIMLGILILFIDTNKMYMVA